MAIERRNGHQIEMLTIKRPEFIEVLIDTSYMDLFRRNFARCNVVAAMCMHRRAQSDMAFYKRVSAMTCTVERRAINDSMNVHMQ